MRVRKGRPAVTVQALNWATRSASPQTESQKANGIRVLFNFHATSSFVTITMPHNVLRQFTSREHRIFVGLNALLNNCNASPTRHPITFISRAAAEQKAQGDFARQVRVSKCKYFRKLIIEIVQDPGEDLLQ